MLHDVFFYPKGTDGCFYCFNDLWGGYTSLFPILLDHYYVTVIGTNISQDMVNLLCQCFDGVDLSVGEVLLVNYLDPAPVLLICNVHCCIISLTKKC